MRYDPCGLADQVRRWPAGADVGIHYPVADGGHDCNLADHVLHLQPAAVMLGADVRADACKAGVPAGLHSLPAACRVRRCSNHTTSCGKAEKGGAVVPTCSAVMV